MILKDGQKWACRSCITGHRSSKCTHNDRELFPIMKKGRPSSHCKVCREAGLSGNSNEPAPPGCTCQAKRKARSQAGSAPGSISPDNVHSGGHPSGSAAPVISAAGGVSSVSDVGAGKRRKNSDSAASIYSTDDRRSSTSHASIYSASSDNAFPYSNSASSSATSSPAHQHLAITGRIPYYTQYTQDGDHQSGTLPDPRLYAPHLNAGQQPMLPPIFPTQEGLQQMQQYYQQQQQLLQNTTDSSTSMSGSHPYSSRQAMAEDLPWWMYRTGLSQEALPQSGLQPATEAPYSHHNNPYTTDEFDHVHQNRQMSASVPSHWQPTHSESYSHFADHQPEAYHSQQSAEQQQHQSQPLYSTYSPQQQHQHIQHEQESQREFARYSPTQQVQEDQWFGGVNNDHQSAQYSTNLTDTPAVWDNELHNPGYYPSQPTVQPHQPTGGSRSGTPALVEGGASDSSNSRTNSSESAANVQARPNLTDISATHVSAPGYMQMGDTGSGVENMTGDTGYFFNRAGPIMNLKLPDKKRKTSTEW